MPMNTRSPASQRIIIGYIAGAGHSGSTLTDLLLGSQPGIVSFGEIKMLDRVRGGSNSKGQCTCGRSLNECPIWACVLAALHSKRLPTDAVEPDHKFFVKTNSAIFEELAHRTGEHVIIDSSKSVNRLRGLFTMPRDRFDVRVIHLVRDGRAVAYSNTRKGRPFPDWIKQWRQQNREVEATSEITDRYMRVRYEDLVADPQAFVRQLLEFLDVKTPENVSLDWTEREKHNMGGNRMRRRKDAVIAPDNEYLTGLSDRQWRQAGRIAGDLLRRYGYEEFPAGRGGFGARGRDGTASIFKRFAALGRK